MKTERWQGWVWDGNRLTPVLVEEYFDHNGNPTGVAKGLRRLRRALLRAHL